MPALACLHQMSQLPFSSIFRRAQGIDIIGKGVVSSYKKGGGKMQAYCVKCRTKREMKDAKSVVMKNGRPATQGVCPVCGTKIFRIGKS